MPVRRLTRHPAPAKGNRAPLFPATPNRFRVVTGANDMGCLRGNSQGITASAASKVER